VKINVDNERNDEINYSKSEAAALQPMNAKESSFNFSVRARRRNNFKILSRYFVESAIHISALAYHQQSLLNISKKFFQ